MFFSVVLAEESYWFFGWRDQSFLGLFFVLSMSIDISGLTASLASSLEYRKSKKMTQRTLPFLKFQDVSSFHLLFLSYNIRCIMSRVLLELRGRNVMEEVYSIFSGTGTLFVETKFNFNDVIRASNN